MIHEIWRAIGKISGSGSRWRSIYNRIGCFKAELLVVYHFYMKPSARIVGSTQHSISQRDILNTHKLEGISAAHWIDDAIRNKFYNVGLRILQYQTTPLFTHLEKISHWAKNSVG